MEVVILGIPLELVELAVEVVEVHTTPLMVLLAQQILVVEAVEAHIAGQAVQAVQVS